MGHTFGDDGVFWMEYSDMLETFMFLHRTRLFDERWTVVQQWTSTNVAWVTGYLQAKFEIEVKKAGVVIIVLTQLDDRYFQGLEGQYWFELHFILQEVGSQIGDHICRVRPVHKWENRSVSCEVELEPGKYEVLPKISATRNEGKKPVEEVVKEYVDNNPQKLRQVGMQYDLAHAKGGVVDEDDALEKKKLKDKKKREESNKKRRANKKKAIGEAAKAIEKAAEAMKEIAVSDNKESADAKTDEKKAKADNEKKGDAKQDSSEAKETDKPTAAEPTSELQKSVGAAQQTEAPKEADAKVELKPEEVKTEETAADDDAPEEDVESDTEDESEDEGDDQGPTSPWNAVCVLGLRVYARDPEVSIKLVKPTEKDENTSLTVEGQPAGATM
jgi:hypothetical protein